MKLHNYVRAILQSVANIYGALMLDEFCVVRVQLLRYSTNQLISYVYLILCLEEGQWAVRGSQIIDLLRIDNE